jgi:hypothetical protein
MFLKERKEKKKKRKKDKITENYKNQFPLELQYWGLVFLLFISCLLR